MVSRLQKLLMLAALGAATVTATSSQPSSRAWQSHSIGGNTFNSADWANAPSDTDSNSATSDFGNPKSVALSEIPASILGMEPARAHKFILIHGILASVALVAVLPLGSILIRIVPSKSAWIAHAVTQVLGYAMYVAGAAMGIYLVSTIRIPYPEANTSLLELSGINYHFIIGLVVLIVLLFQPLTGVVHHIKYKRSKTAAVAAAAAAANVHHRHRQNSSSTSSSTEKEYNNNGANGSGSYVARTVWSHAHIWLGRLTITMGMINGALGLYISSTEQNSKTTVIIAYSVGAGLMWLVWLASVVYGEVSRMRARAADRRKPRSMRVAEGAYTGGTTYAGGGAGLRGGGYAIPRNRGDF